MAKECVIPENLVKAFREAAGEFREWRKYGGPESQVMFDGTPHSIGCIADLASEFDNPMPADVFDLLNRIGGFGGGPKQNIFSAGGPYLRRVYTEHQHLLANRQESRLHPRPAATRRLPPTKRF